MFQLTAEEAWILKCQSGNSSSGHGGRRRSLPYAFTEQRVAMLSSVLRSERAVLINVAIMRAFSLSAANGERGGVRCRNGHFAVRLVAAFRQSAASSVGRQTREQEDGGALPRRRYAEKMEDGSGAAPRFL
jgi:hypothetical protein